MSKSISSTFDDSILSQEPHELLDARGLLCPEPVMMLHNVIKKLPQGGLVKILATDTSTLRDIPRFCEHLGHELLISPSEEHPLTSGNDTIAVLTKDKNIKSEKKEEYTYWLKKKG